MVAGVRVLRGANLAGLVNVAADEARAQHRNAYAVRCQIQPQRIAEAHHRELGSGIQPHARAHQQTGHGGGIHDMARLAVCLEVRQKCLHTVHHAVKVHAQHPVPVTVLRLVHGPEEADACIVEQQMHLAERGHGGCRCCLHGRAVRHVHHHSFSGNARRAQLRHRYLQWLLTHIGEHHFDALGAKDLGEA